MGSPLISKAMREKDVPIEDTEKISKREIRNPKHEVLNNDPNTNAPMIKTS